MKLKYIADYISQELLKQGFIIHRYDAYSTCSIYLKLDYGAMHSIRISDHKGKEHLSYRYNIESGVKFCKWCKDNKGLWKYYCSTKKEDIDNLINIIISDKIKRKSFYNYDLLIKQCKEDSVNARGFWKQAWEVKL